MQATDSNGQVTDASVYGDELRQACVGDSVGARPLITGRWDTWDVSCIAMTKVEALVLRQQDMCACERLVLGAWDARTAVALIRSFPPHWRTVVHDQSDEGCVLGCVCVCVCVCVAVCMCVCMRLLLSASVLFTPEMKSGVVCRLEREAQGEGEGEKEINKCVCVCMCVCACFWTSLYLCEIPECTLLRVKVNALV